MASVAGVSIIFATILVSLISSIDANCINGTSREHAPISFEDFIATYGKTYKNEAEKKKRAGIFLENYRAIKDHNELYESGKSTSKLGINEFSDMTYDEVIRDLTGARTPRLAARYKADPDEWYIPKDIGLEPAYLDYRDIGALNPIRHQGFICGSCWAFALVSSIESNLFLRIGYNLHFSEQDLVDCCHECSPEEGCDGGWADEGIIKVRDEGIAYREEYEYTADDGTCKDVRKVFPVAGLKRIRHNNETELLNALVQMGPVIIDMGLSPTFHQHVKGILVDDICLPNHDHAMLLVGYGTENGLDYWLIRNSWGKGFGEEGYIKMARNVENDCGISYNAYFPVMYDSPTQIKIE